MSITYNGVINISDKPISSFKSVKTPPPTSFPKKTTNTIIYFPMVFKSDSSTYRTGIFFRINNYLSYINNISPTTVYKPWPWQWISGDMFTLGATGQFYNIVDVFQIRNFEVKGQTFGQVNVVVFNGNQTNPGPTGTDFQGLVVNSLYQYAIDDTIQPFSTINVGMLYTDLNQILGNPSYAPKTLSCTVLQSKGQETIGFLFVINYIGNDIVSMIYKLTNISPSTDAAGNSLNYQWNPYTIPGSINTSTMSSDSSVRGNLVFIPCIYLHETNIINNGNNSLLMVFTDPSRITEYVYKPNTEILSLKTNALLNPLDTHFLPNQDKYNGLTPFTVSQSLDGSTLFVIYNNPKPQPINHDNVAIRIVAFKRASNSFIGESSIGDTFVAVGALNIYWSVFAKSPYNIDLTQITHIVCEPIPRNINSYTGTISYFKITPYIYGNFNPTINSSTLGFTYYFSMYLSTSNKGKPGYSFLTDIKHNIYFNTSFANWTRNVQSYVYETLLDRGYNYGLYILQTISPEEAIEYRYKGVKESISESISETTSLLSDPILVRGNKYPIYLEEDIK